MENKSNAKTGRNRQDKATAPVIMSMSELAKLGGGKIAYIKVMTADEAKEMFPAVEGIPAGIDLLRFLSTPRSTLVERRPFDPTQAVPGTNWDRIDEFPDLSNALVPEGP